MNIRLEQPKDYREVEYLTREAFWNVYRPGCTEHYVLNQYRTNPDFIPGLDFVMELDGRIIGHVMFSRAEIVLDNDCPIEGKIHPAWTFGPISIHPDYKRKGYGLKLLNYAIEKAREMGIGISTNTRASTSPANSISITMICHGMKTCRSSSPKN